MAINKQFVIISLPRSGSNLLVSMLNGHPDIICEGELFNLKNIRKNRSSLIAWFVSKFPMPYLAKRKKTLNKKGKSVYGFKLLLSQWPGDMEKGLSILNSHNYRMVFLFRRDTIAQILSYTVAIQEKKWVVRSKDEYNKNSLELDLTVVERAMKGIEQNIRLYQKLKKEYTGLELFYEDDLINPAANGPKIAKKIADFFETENHLLTNFTLKTDLRSDRERISNLDEFLNFCRSKGYTKEVDYYLANQQKMASTRSTEF